MNMNKLKNAKLKTLLRIIKATIGLLIINTLLTIVTIEIMGDKLATTHSSAEFTILFLAIIGGLFCGLLLLGFIVTLILTFVFSKTKILSKKFIATLNTVIFLAIMLFITNLFLFLNLGRIKGIHILYLYVIINSVLIGVFIKVMSTIKLAILNKMNAKNTDT